MNIIIFFPFFYFINIALSNSINSNFNLNYNINRLALRCVIFKEKKITKALKNFANLLKIYHNKSIVSVAEGIVTYNELSEDDKTIIETIISLCY